MISASSDTAGKDDWEAEAVRFRAGGTKRLINLGLGTFIGKASLLDTSAFFLSNPGPRTAFLQSSQAPQDGEGRVVMYKHSDIAETGDQGGT